MNPVLGSVLGVKAALKEKMDFSEITRLVVKTVGVYYYTRGIALVAMKENKCLPPPLRGKVMMSAVLAGM